MARQLNCHSCRYWIVLVATASMTFLYGSTVAFNFTIICMLRPAGASASVAGRENVSALSEQGSTNATSQQYHGDQYDYSAVERSMLFSALALGCLLFSPLITILITRFGLKRAYLACGWLSVISTLLIPFSARLGFFPLLIARVVQGSGHAVTLSMIGSVGSEWAPMAASASYFLVLSNCYQFGPILTMPLSSLMCTSSLGWPYVYYFMGAASALLLVLIHLFYWERPDSKESWASKREVAIIHAGRNPSTQAGPISELDVPYRAIITDPVVWITMLAFFADELGYFALTQYGPIYLHKAVGLSVEGTGWGAALPHLVSMATKFVVGRVNERITFVSEETRTRMWAMISTIGSTLCFVVLALLPILTNLGLVAVPHWAVQTIFTIVNIFTCLAWLGLFKSALMISGPFSHVLTTWTMMVSSVALLLVPLFVGLIAPNYSAQEWVRVFFAIAAIELMGISMFAAKCDSKPRKWTLIAPRGGVDGPAATANGTNGANAIEGRWQMRVASTSISH